MKKSVLIFTMLFTCITLLMISCTAENVGENSEGSEGVEGFEGGNESGMLWGINQTADEIVNGIHLILSYDAATSSFVGTLENINTTIASQVRVEVHVFDANDNSTEFGPTIPGDMEPGETRNVSLVIAQGTSFVAFNMHPEVGGSGS